MARKGEAAEPPPAAPWLPGPLRGPRTRLRLPTIRSFPSVPPPRPRETRPPAAPAVTASRTRRRSRGVQAPAHSPLPRPPSPGSAERGAVALSSSAFNSAVPGSEAGRSRSSGRPQPWRRWEPSRGQRACFCVFPASLPRRPPVGELASVLARGCARARALSAPAGHCGPSPACGPRPEQPCALGARPSRLGLHVPVQQPSCSDSLINED